MSATAEVALPRCLRSSTASSASSTRQPIPVPSRRTSQQVQAEKLAKKVATQNTVKRQQEAVVNVVKKNELRLQQQAEAENHADHPPTSAAVVVKVGRQRPGAPSHHKSAFEANIVEEEELETDIQDQSYHPDELSQESESESDLFDENISDEDLAPEKRRKRGETRAMLESLRDCNRELTGSGDAAVLGKRKADSQSQPKSLKKKKKGLPPSGGLRVGWILEASSKGNIGMVPQGADNDGGSEDGCEDMDHDIVAGISDNEEGDALEKQTVATAPRARLIARVQNAASIVEISKTASVVKTTSVEEFLPPSQAAAVVTSLKRIRFRDMPKELAASFNKIFIPLVYQLIACGSDPWYQPTDRDLEGLWAIASPDDVLYQDVEIRKIVSKLTRDAITSWRNKIGAHAIKCLETAVFAALPSGSGNELIETRQVYALWALQGGDRERNYYYREIDDGVDLGGNSSEESPQAPKKKGIFQSKLIASTLGVYFNSIAKLPSKNVSNNFPSAALVLAMQAVKRALMRYRTGVSVAPSGSLSHFSKSNWGDHEDTVAGDRVKVRSTSGLVDVVKKLREPTQKKIIEAAKAEAALQAVRVNNTGHDVTRASDGEQGEEESDFEIVDDDDDDE